MIPKKLLNKIKGKKIIVACSGGVDSVVLAHALKEAEYDLILTHLNHGLRGEESDKDEELVRSLAKEWNLLFLTKAVKIPKKGNLENRAREMRYQFLDEIRKQENADYIVTAHHLDDQIETILMHMSRGCGLRGQIGMREVNGNLIRPLLNIPRKEIEKYAEENSLKYRTDQSNFDLSYDRNYWRNLVIPYLKKEMKDLGERVIKISQEAEKELDKVSKKAKAWLEKEGFKRSEFKELSDDLKAEILIQIFGERDLYGKHLESLISFICSGETGKEMKIKDRWITLEYDNVFFGKAEGESLSRKPLTKLEITWGEWKIRNENKEELYVRSWKTGDRFQPNGMKGTKKIQDYFVDAKIPKRLRKQIPIIVNGDDEIVSIGNIRYAEEQEKKFKNLKIEKL